jgi:hypothetical protein
VSEFKYAGSGLDLFAAACSILPSATLAVTTEHYYKWPCNYPQIHPRLENWACMPNRLMAGKA